MGSLCPCHPSAWAAFCSRILVGPWQCLAACSSSLQPQSFALLAHGQRIVPCSPLAVVLLLCHLSSSSSVHGAGWWCWSSEQGWFLLAASLRRLRRSREQSSNHLPKFRASNLWAQSGGSFKPVRPPTPPQQWQLKAPLISLASRCVLMAKDVR